jgi:hypothetical protein
MKVIVQDIFVLTGFEQVFLLQAGGCYKLLVFKDDSSYRTLKRYSWCNLSYQIPAIGGPSWKTVAQQ